jgi:hypothetical protein
MQITVELPEDIARHANPGREALEYSIEDLQQDLADLEKLRMQGLLRK